ncbi:MAG: methyltransferase [Reyranella sp.]|nr:methyltransferase [Reyranella sp.]
MRPSEYTASLIQFLRADADRVRKAHVLEIGSGSGVVLASLGGLGAAALCGVDIEGDAVASSRLLLQGLGYSRIAEIYQGDMWRPVAGRRFDLIVANLPHFPMEPVEVAGRLPTWSAGGTDGRRLLDVFLEGLKDHLAPGGRSVITHNAFVDVERSRTVAGARGLSLSVVMTTLIHVSEEKLARMTPAVLCAEEGRSIYRYGPYAFAEMHIVEIVHSNMAI